MQVSVNGMTVEYTTEGAGEAILFVHGFPLNSSIWQPQVRELSDQYQCILVDLPGFGQAPPPGEAATMAGYATALAAVLDELREERAVLVGLSMGGYVLFEFFRLFPERVRALVLADTRAVPDTEEGRGNRIRTAEQVLEEGPAVLVRNMLPSVLAPGASEELRQQVSEMIRSSHPEGIAGALRAMAARPDSRPDLPTINVPTLVIVGREDGITPPEEASAMADAIAGSNLEIIEGAGHLSNLERPEAFNAALLRFLDDLALPPDLES